MHRGDALQACSRALWVAQTRNEQFFEVCSDHASPISVPEISRSPLTFLKGLLGLMLLVRWPQMRMQPRIVIQCSRIHISLQACVRSIRLDVRTLWSATYRSFLRPTSLQHQTVLVLIALSKNDARASSISVEASLSCPEAPVEAKKLKNLQGESTMGSEGKYSGLLLSLFISVSLQTRNLPPSYSQHFVGFD